MFGTFGQQGHQLVGIGSDENVSCGDYSQSRRPRSASFRFVPLRLLADARDVATACVVKVQTTSSEGRFPLGSREHVAR